MKLPLLIERDLIRILAFVDEEQWDKAWEAVETVAPQNQQHPIIVSTRLMILSGLERFAEALAEAEDFIARGKHFTGVYVYGALAVRELHSIAEAREFLLRGESHCSNKGQYLYTLACFDAQLGYLDEARANLKKALRLDPELEQQVEDEEDLEPLRESFSS